MNPLKDGALTNNFAGLGTVTPEMVHTRALELARIDGRNEGIPSKAEHEQARRELTGEPDIDPNDAVLEAAPESARWEPVYGSTGCKTPTSPSEDEDEEGRSDQERMVEEGGAEAELDRMNRASLSGL
jgi:hypothetical protein